LSHKQRAIISTRTLLRNLRRAIEKSRHRSGY